MKPKINFMRNLLTILALILLAAAPFSMEAANNTRRTIVLKKTPRNPNEQEKIDKRIPSPILYCYVDRENGIQQLDTSDVESYEVWDDDDTSPIVAFADESLFVDYVLNTPPRGLVKLYSEDYIYIGNIQ